MANHKATKKDVRQAESVMSVTVTTVKLLVMHRDLKAVTEKATAENDLTKVASMLDKLAKRNVNSQEQSSKSEKQAG